MIYVWMALVAAAVNLTLLTLLALLSLKAAPRLLRKAMRAPAKPLSARATAKVL